MRRQQKKDIPAASAASSHPFPARNIVAKFCLSSIRCSVRPLHGHEANNNDQLFGPVLLVSNVKRLKRPRTLSSSLAVTFIDYVIHFVVFFADSGTTCSLLVAHCKDS